METGEDQGSKTLRHWHVQLWLDHEGWSQNLGLCFVGPAVNPLVNCRYQGGGGPGDALDSLSVLWWRPEIE